MVIISRVKRIFTYLKKRTKKSLKFYMISLMMLLAVVPSAIAYTTVIRTYESRAVSLRTAEIQNQCIILCDQLNQYNYLDNTSSDVINANLIQLTNIYNGRVMIVDQGLHVIKDTYALDEGKIVTAESVVKCMGGTSSSYFDKKNQYIEVTSPIMSSEGDKVEGVMVASVSTSTIADSVSIFYTKGKVIFGIVFVISLALSFLAAEKLVKPLKKISSEIEGITEGYDYEGLHVDSYRETTQISEAFNKMFGRLKMLDDSREEFVSNVSHELKTPLASMKVLADSLLIQEGIPIEIYQEFMQDITAEIDRENEIISDLLTLVKMDKTTQNLNIKQTNINELLEQILKRLRPIAEKKKIDLVLESFRPVMAEIDEVKMTLAISNLVENGIKYNHEEGWVHVSLNADPKYFYIRVTDSGMGIPEEEQAHVFERFYRVDKSHSREIGGTGLGLAIARSAVIVHKGAIKVYSENGEGTTFTVRIPLIYVAS